MATGLDRLVPQRLGDGTTPRTLGALLLHEACVEALSDSAFPVWSVKAKALLLYLIKTDEDGARDWARSSSAEVEEALRAKYPELYKAVAEELQSRTVPASEPDKETQLSHSANPRDSSSMSTGSMPKPGDTVSVTLHNKETIEGTVEWVDGNGAWIKGAQRARWVPIEYFVRPDLVNPPPKPASELGEKAPKARKEDSESEE